MIKVTHNEIVAEYRRAFAEGDTVTTYEILQFAKHDDVLSTEILALEEELLEDAPTFDIDVDHVTAPIYQESLARRSLDKAEAWVLSRESGVRATFRFWPVAAALVFGLSLYGLGMAENDVSIAWLACLAIISFGSIAIVCSSSLWQTYSGWQRKQPIPPIARLSSYLEKRALGDDADDQHFSIEDRGPDDHSRLAAAAGLATAISVAIVALLVILNYRGQIDVRDDVLAAHRIPLDEQLLANGTFDDSSSFLFPIRIDANIPVDQPLLISAEVSSESDPFELAWTLSIVGEEGELIAVSRNHQELASVTVPKYSGSSGIVFATIELNRDGHDHLVSDADWSLYGTGVTTRYTAIGRGVDLHGDAVFPSEIRLGWVPEFADLRRNSNPTMFFPEDGVRVTLDDSVDLTIVNGEISVDSEDTEPRKE